MTAKRHTSEQLTLLVGFEPDQLAELQAAGFLPGQDRFSRGDLAAAMMVLFLDDLGVSTRLAIAAAMAARPALEVLFMARGEALRALPIVAVVDASELDPEPTVMLVRSDERIGDLLARVLDRRCVVVDLLELAHNVTQELRTGEYPETRDAREIVAAAGARAFGNAGTGPAASIPQTATEKVTP